MLVKAAWSRSAGSDDTKLVKTVSRVAQRVTLSGWKEKNMHNDLQHAASGARRRLAEHVKPGASPAAVSAEAGRNSGKSELAMSSTKGTAIPEAYQLRQIKCRHAKASHVKLRQVRPMTQDKLSSHFTYVLLCQLRQSTLRYVFEVLCVQGLVHNIFENPMLADPNNATLPITVSTASGQTSLQDLKLAYFCKCFMFQNLGSQDLVQAYFFECLMLQSLGVGSVQTRELLRSELTQLKRLGSSVGCELRAFGCSMFSSSRSSTETGTALDHMASSLGKNGRRVLCGEEGGSSTDGRAHSKPANSREERENVKREGSGAHAGGDMKREVSGARRTSQDVSAPGFFRAATAATAFDTAADAAMETTARTLGKLRSGEVAARTSGQAGSTQSTRVPGEASLEMPQEHQEQETVATEARRAHTCRSLASARAFAQAFTYADGDPLPSQPAMHSKTQGIPATAFQMEASRLSPQPLLQSSGERRHNPPPQDSGAGRQSPFATGKMGRMSPAPSAPSAMPLPTASPTSAAATTAQAYSLPAALPDAARNPGLWRQPLLAMPSLQPARPAVLASNPSWLGLHAATHLPTMHRRRNAAQGASLCSAPSAYPSLSTEDSFHPAFSCSPPSRTASLRSSRSASVSLSAVCLPKCWPKVADTGPDAPVRVVEMCRLINLRPG
ncbi:hypothetical protein DUNSADRAFT_60 [Dunaliella salina]|uniref:Uncharacterized protein n=1 Tax=Dunaliella salina TaxID=3046 RepID=A0ABQ7HAQ5_DUNSA|nr:hypothetical protein DUNSADRAFT_60 [Dunaliella salina]|eukprot:KAF5843938.1 hypothetical protein DUNSADRAFT_60 [Dunaliella salina]